MSGALLEVTALHGWYGESHVLHGVDLHVDEGDVGLLRDKGLHHRCADPRPTAGDEDDFVVQRRIACVGHGGLIVQEMRGMRD